MFSVVSNPHFGCGCCFNSLRPPSIRIIAIIAARVHNTRRTRTALDRLLFYRLAGARAARNIKRNVYGVGEASGIVNYVAGVSSARSIVHGRHIRTHTP